MPELDDEVPPGYAEWLRLVALGIDDEELAARLGIPLEALANFAALAARKVLVRACGTPGGSKFTTLHGKATIDGVGFFDVKHATPQRGVAPNNIELHPVLRFANASCRRG